ncbi:DUF63 family protein [Halopenitus sp. H-Gu1]|uniref:DUF63 family protein n=1 Tax=Halopenitus sp. H-Gu1 TaxID=3242697 RepID=UPI00359DB731
MAFLPEGFTLPALPHLVILIAAVALVAAAFRRDPPQVGKRHVLALAPWMVVGSCTHVLYVIGALPETVRPFAGTPAVYLTIAAIAGATWIAAESAASIRPRRVPAVLAAIGLVVLVPIVSLALATGARSGSLSPMWPAIALVLSAPIAAATWMALVRTVPRTAVTGEIGALAVFGHTLDGVSTAVGVDVLGFGERTPLSRIIMEVAGGLPTPEALGVGWLFVVVKLAVASLVVVLFADYVEADPAEGYLLLGFIAAVGLGPGAHNLLLFTVSG